MMMEKSRKALKNSFADRELHFNQVAVSDSPGRMRNVRMLQSWILCPEGHTLPYEVSPGALLEQPTVFDCNVITIDDYVTDRGLSRLDLLKIDVEGYEMKVLKGALRSLARFKPRIILELSYYVGDISGSIQRFIDFLFYLDYRLFDVSGGEIDHALLVAEFPYYTSCDIIMLPGQYRHDDSCLF